MSKLNNPNNPQEDNQSEDTLDHIRQISQSQKQEPKETLVGSLLNTIARLGLIIVLLLLIIVFIVGIGSGLWLQTYKALTQEKLVAVVEVEEHKEDSDGYPYFKMTYTPVENPSALTKALVKDSGGSDKKQVDKSKEYYIHGDRFMVEAEVINFGDWANVLGFKTVYKVTRIQGSYSDTDQERTGKRSVYDVNGGIDPVWETLEYNQEVLRPFVQGVYGSAVTQGVRREKTKWGIYMTEDGLIMEKLD